MLCIIWINNDLQAILFWFYLQLCELGFVHSPGAGLKPALSNGQIFFRQDNRATVNWKKVSVVIKGYIRRSQARMDHSSPLCEQLFGQIVQQFKNNRSHRIIARNLVISSSTVHNIKRFSESRLMSAPKRQGPKPTQNACDLRSLSCHWI